MFNNEYTFKHVWNFFFLQKLTTCWVIRHISTNFKELKSSVCPLINNCNKNNVLTMLLNTEFSVIKSVNYNVQCVTDFIFLGSKITVDSNCSHDIKRRLLPGRRVMTNLDSILKTIALTIRTFVVKVMSAF